MFGPVDSEAVKIFLPEQKNLKDKNKLKRENKFLKVYI
jgi:hypothetical protein